MTTPRSKQLVLKLSAEDLPVPVQLERDHYLGASKTGPHHTYADRFGVMVFAHPRSRRLPSHWLELVRWCLVGEKNGGSRQWSAAVAWIRARFPVCSTVVSYSDPNVGHTGALYRACNWLWAPTWHRLREPPTGNGDWGDGRRRGVKDRWIFPLLADESRSATLAVSDESVLKIYPWASWREPKIRRGVPGQGTGGGDFKRWSLLQQAALRSE